MPSAPAAWTVLVVEDDNFTRSLLVSLLRATGIETIVDSASAAEALRELERLDQPAIDAAVLDLDLGPGPSGLDLAVELRERNPDIGLVLLTSFTDPRLKDSRAVIPRGLVYLTKTEGTDAASILSALRRAIRQPAARPSGVPRTDLTTTQIDVLAAVASGATTAQIAAQRGVSEKAIEQVIARLCDALDIPRGSDANPRVHLTRRYHEMTGNLP